MESCPLLLIDWFQGLYDIVLGQQPRFCVVSNGAEVIMIDKEFFLEHATDRVLKDIRVEVGLSISS